MLKKMKICFVSDFFYPNVGGVETHSYQLAKSLLKEDIDVHILTNSKKDYTIDGIKVHRSYAKILPKLNVVGSLHVWYILSYFFKKMGFDVVHAHSIYSPLALISTTIANFRNIPTILSIHSLHPEKKGFILKHMNKFIKIGMNKSKKLICVSEAAKNSIQNIYDPKKVKVIPNTIDRDEFFEIKKNKEITITSIFRMVKSKGGKYLIFALRDIIKKYNNLKINIIGNGPKLGDLKKLAKKLKIYEYINFIEEIKRSKLIEILTKSHIFVYPTLVEASGITILEAMMSRCGCILTNVGGISEFANESNSILVEPKGSMQITKAIDRLISDQKLCQKLADNAKEMVEKSFTWDSKIDEYTKVYNEILGVEHENNTCN